MEVSVISVAGAIVLVCLVTWIVKIVNWVWLRPKKLERCLRQQGLNGNPYTLLYGDMKQNSTMRKEALSRPITLSDDIVPRILPFFNHNIQKYGKDSFFWLGGLTPRVIIMDPELIREVFTKLSEFHKLSSRQPLLKLLAKGLANHEGEKWTKHRKIINPAFHVEKLKLMLPAMYLSCSEMIDKWETLASVEGSCDVDAWPYLQNLTADVISRTAFGSSYEEGRTIFQLQREQAVLFSKAIQMPDIPGWRFVPTKTNKRMRQIDNSIQSLLRGIINKRENAMKAGKAANDDLLGILLESNTKEIQDHNSDKNVGMSIEDVIDECKLFYFAGQETTLVLLVWTMVLLSKHPTWQERARAEVLQLFGDKKPDYEGLSRLKVVTMILNEVLRLYPPIVGLARTVQKETKLGRLTLPAGVQISIPTLLVHHDRDIWGDDAKEFKPERFAEGISKATKNQESFFPFGWGPRICIGQNFAMIEAKLALAMMLQHFWFELSPSYAHAPSPVITLQPQYGCQIILIVNMKIKTCKTLEAAPMKAVIGRVKLRSHAQI